MSDEKEWKADGGEVVARIVFPVEGDPVWTVGGPLKVTHAAIYSDAPRPWWKRLGYRLFGWWSPLIAVHHFDDDEV